MPFPVDQSFIEAAERQLGRTLPRNLRKRLLRDNGGEVEAADDDWNLHPVFDTTDRRRIKRTANHIIRETELARQWRGFPPDAIAIAENGTGDRLIVRRDSDEIEIWYHETGETEPVSVKWE
jgi:SMI1/KNR4 family protein SUKH-1